VYPLHVGDTWRDPFVGARSEDIQSADHPRLHAYTDTRGLPELIEAVREKLVAHNGLTHNADEILITAGATGGLSAVTGAVLSPGDEMLILAPFWPLIRGIAQSFRANPVEVPFFDRVASAEEAVRAVEARITSKSRVLYVSTPSNPTGRILPRKWLAALADLARRHDLWIFSDEVYEDYYYGMGADIGGDADRHESIAQFAPERTVSVYSFSKSYAMAGQRVGYLAGPAPLIENARKIGTHIYYHPPVVGQRTALAAIKEGEEWIKAAHAQDRDVGREVAAILGERQPQGGTFLFLDVRDRLDERGLSGVLEDCFEAGVLVAPGPSCGVDYGEWIRLSYTAAPEPDVVEAARRLARVLGRD
jgi:N-succinyldiaminopimelate aminotransferase